MQFQLNTKLVTNGKEQRIQENDFEVKLNGYILLPIGIPLKIVRYMDEESVGEGIIKSITLVKETTMIQYQLISIKSIN